MRKNTVLFREVWTADLTHANAAKVLRRFCHNGGIGPSPVQLPANRRGLFPHHLPIRRNLEAN